MDREGQSRESHTSDRASGYKSLASDKRNTSLMAMLLYPTIMRGKEKRVFFKRGYCEKYKGDIKKKEKKRTANCGKQSGF